MFYYSPDRGGEHPEQHLADYSSIMQADAYAGFNGLYVAERKPGLITEAACWAHGRRKLFELAELQKAPIAIEAVRRIDELFAIEREINGLSGDQRVAVRTHRSKRSSTTSKSGCAKSTENSPPEARSRRLLPTA